MRNSTFRVCDIRRHYVYETELADAGFKMPKLVVIYAQYISSVLTISCVCVSVSVHTVHAKKVVFINWNVPPLYIRYYCDYCDTYLTHDSVS